MHDDEKEHISSLFISIPTLLGIIMIFTIFSISPSSADKYGYIEYAVVFLPSVTQRDAAMHVFAAGGSPVRNGNFSNIIIAASNQTDFQENIRQQGAIFTFSPFIKGGCIIQNFSTFKPS